MRSTPVLLVLFAAGPRPASASPERMDYAFEPPLTPAGSLDVALDGTDPAVPVTLLR